MRRVGIKQLKAHLSHYVRAARSGETILVSDRGEVVAELGPVRRQPPAAGSIDEVLDRLAREGKVTRSGEPKRGWSWSARPLGLRRGTATALLDELRQDR